MLLTCVLLSSGIGLAHNNVDKHGSNLELIYIPFNVYVNTVMNIRIRRVLLATSRLVRDDPKWDHAVTCLQGVRRIDVRLTPDSIFY